MSNDFSRVKLLNQLKNKIYFPRLNSAYKSTICFFEDDEKEELAPAGSGIFLKKGDNYFVVTASHVFADHYEETFVAVKNIKLNLGGDLSSTEKTSEGIKTDISVCKLNEFCIEKLLSRYQPLNFSQLAFGHEIQNRPNYFIVGFPLTRTKKVWNKNEVKSQAFTYQSEPHQKFNYERFNFRSDISIPLKFDGEVTSAKFPNPHLAPDLYGISGGGLWYFHGKNKKSLIGIVIEKVENPGNKAVIATKIEVVQQLIHELENPAT